MLEGGPWEIARKPLCLQPWTPSMEMEKVNVHVIPLWISLPKLPFQFWSSEALSIIGSVVGKLLFTDKSTKSKKRLSYARMHVEVEAATDLKDTITITTEDSKRFVLQVIYDWNPSRCDTYKCFGHAKTQCPKQAKPKQMWVLKKVNLKKVGESSKYAKRRVNNAVLSKLEEGEVVIEDDSCEVRNKHIKEVNTGNDYETMENEEIYLLEENQGDQDQEVEARDSPSAAKSINQYQNFQRHLPGRSTTQ